MKLSNYLPLLLLSVLLFGCGGSGYKLSEMEKGHPFQINKDNSIFTEDRIFRYELSFTDAAGQPKALIMEKHQLEYNDTFPAITPAADTNWYMAEVKYIQLSAQKIERAEDLANKGQTNVIYRYYNSKKEPLPFTLKTSVVDNPINILLHPPRTSFFEVLNLSAYPYVIFPLAKGKKWEFDQLVGKQWANEEIAIWKGDYQMFSHAYEVLGKENIRIGNRTVECYRIHAETTSELGTSSSDFYFHDTYGFVAMQFRNLNNSLLSMKLLEL